MRTLTRFHLNPATQFLVAAGAACCLMGVFAGVALALHYVDSNAAPTVCSAPLFDGIAQIILQSEVRPRVYL